MSDNDEPIDDGYRDPDIDGCHHCHEPRTCEECAKEKERDEHIEYRVKMADSAVSDAEKAIAAATANLHELVSGDAWYIELAEGADGGDALADLTAAARLLRNVGRITREHKRLLKET